MIPDFSPEWWSDQVARAIGILPPEIEHEHWLLLHRSEAATCMSSWAFRLLTKRMGWNNV